MEIAIAIVAVVAFAAVITIARRRSKAKDGGPVTPGGAGSTKPPHADTEVK